MGNMKTFLTTLLIAGLAFLGLDMYRSSLSSCEVPFGYRIGDVDSRFGLAPDALQSVLKKAENVWETASGKDLLEYSPGAAFPIDFVFDERQERTLEAKKLDTRLESLETSQAKLEREYTTLSALYEKKLKEYRQKSAAYQEAVSDFNKKIDYWNERGGAPPDEYEEIKDEEKSLKAIARELEEDFRRLNDYAEKSGTLAEKDAALVESYNEEITTFEERYGAAREFDQGLYTGDRITIYQFAEEADLVLALAHEFGHALLIDHIADDPAALMYPLLEKQNLLAPALTQADLAALTKACESKKPFVLRKARELLSK